MGDGRVRVLLARHGEAAYETEGVGDGGGSLTSLGRSQAHSLGLVARREGMEAVWCSSLSRAVQTAEIAASVVGVPVTVREALVEFDVGDIRGLPYDPDVIEPVMASWLGGDVDGRISGGETGREAALRVLDELALDADGWRWIGSVPAEQQHAAAHADDETGDRADEA